MIEVKHLTKYYGSKRAVNDISFTVSEGEILGFLGPNGAGKSTTMNILTGYISSSDGEVLINGVDILDDPVAAKKNIGYLPELPPLYLDMTVKEYLGFVYDLKKCRLPKEAHLEEVCGLVRIKDVYDRMIKNLSKGYKQRVGMAQALVGNPPILILDEPTVGLDPKQIIDIRNLIKKLGKKHTVILSSHILSEIQAVADRIVIINQGEIVADDTMDNITRSVEDELRYTLRVSGADDEKKVIEVLKGIKGVKDVSSLGSAEEGSFDFELDVDEDTDIRRDLFKRIADRNWYMLGLKSNEMTLEDIFLKITMGSDVNFKGRKPVDEQLQRQLMQQIGGAVAAAEAMSKSGSGQSFELAEEEGSEE
ncbi:MAG: ATP-binding cassette domain-containing protein [Oscillospiraceae bacterium]|nr:ATP-binding cassette domain-containing protein [Oscillospiraceae bacterium]